MSLNAYISSTMPTGTSNYQWRSTWTLSPPLTLSRERKKQHESHANQHELTAFLGLTGKLNFLRHCCLPTAAFAASHLQQITGNLRVADIRVANSAFKEIRQVVPKLLYRSPVSISSATYLTFSDAAQGKLPYGQTSYISGILLDDGTDLIYPVLDWHSSKQSRISFSSIGSEILAAATSAHRSVSMTEGLQALHGADTSLPLVLTVDSLGLHATITTVNESKDYRLRPTVARVRDSFESGEISVIQWIPGQKTIADALTKRNPVMYSRAELDLPVWYHRSRSIHTIQKGCSQPPGASQGMSYRIAAASCALLAQSRDNLRLS